MSNIHKTTMNENRVPPGDASQATAAPVSNVAESGAASPAFAAWLLTYRRRLEQDCEGSASRVLRKSGPEIRRGMKTSQ